MTNAQIIEDVKKCFLKAEERGENWADYLPMYAECDEDRINDTDYVGTLADSREIIYAPWTMDLFIIVGCVRSH